MKPLRAFFTKEKKLEKSDFFKEKSLKPFIIYNLPIKKPKHLFSSPKEWWATFNWLTQHHLSAFTLEGPHENYTHVFKEVIKCVDNTPLCEPYQAVNLLCSYLKIKSIRDGVTLQDQFLAQEHLKQSYLTGIAVSKESPLFENDIIETLRKFDNKQEIAPSLDI